MKNENKNHIVIENIQEGDIEEIRQIGLTTPELQVQDGDEPRYYPYEVLRAFIKSPNDIYLVAKIDGKIAGYIIVTFNPYLKEAYIIDIVVKSEFRGQSISSLLFAEVFKRLKGKGCRWAWLLVKEDNANMMEVVKKKGFEKGIKFRLFYKGRPF